MSQDDPSLVTQLLRRWRLGDEQALSELTPLVYDELRRLARLQLRNERRDHTLEPTALVHEAFARMVDLKLSWQDRAHFLCMASRVMRRVLVDYARKRRSAKRGGAAVRVTLTELQATSEPDFDLLALDEALHRLEAQEKRPARVLELHYFGGLSYRETAEALEISEATVERDLRFSRAWLLRELA